MASNELRHDQKMSDCCSTSCNTNHPNRRQCPGNGAECSEVSARTISHHIKAAWNWSASVEHYYFCDAPDCDVVYFGEDGSTISKSRLCTRSAAKDQSGDALICHCFGICRDDFARDPDIKDFVVAQTKAGVCSCEIYNPSGRCCLKDFQKHRN